MIDEENGVKPVADANSEAVSPTVEPKAQATETEVKEQSEPIKSDESKTEVKSPDSQVDKRSAKGRIRELVSERDSLKEKVDSLSERLNQFTDGFNSQPNMGGLPQVDVQEGETITPERYQQDVAKAASTAAFLQIKQKETVDRINKESYDAIKKFPELDPDSDKFDKDLSDSITEAVESQVKVVTGYDNYGRPLYGLNPSASPLKIVEKLMKPYRKSISSEVASSQEELTKQVAQTAMRPTPAAPKQEKTAKDMSIQELEAKLGKVW